jgi:glycosyltransferase involved in cell wall biosynthesis
VARPELPSFDLVLATVDRVDNVRRFLDSLAAQTHRRFRVLLVDQNDDARLEPVVEHAESEIVRLRAVRGLSRARNRALGELRADLVAFPDDDCLYATDLLERVARRFVEQSELDGLTGRAVGWDGSSTASWKLDGTTLSDRNLWNRAISYTIFLRREVVERVGAFDEQMGLGSGTPWSSAEEIDYLVRGVRSGARIDYDPSLTVTHDAPSLSPRELRDLGYRDGASFGYLLRKHRYPTSEIIRRLVRPLGGVVTSLARLNLPRARFHLANLLGRLRGLRSP